MGMKPETVADYLDHLPTSSRQVVEQIRSIIDEIVPEALHRISYGIPAACLGGRPILFYAAWKKHIGLYPIYSGPPDFEAVIGPYRYGKDTVRLPFGTPIPVDVVKTILAYKMANPAASKPPATG